MTAPKISIQDWFIKVPLRWNSRDPNYWRQILTQANAECIAPTRTEIVYEEELEPQSQNYASTVKIWLPHKKVITLTPATYIKQIRWANWRRPLPKANTYGAEVDEWLLSQIRMASEGLDFVDNHRFAEVGNRADMRRYRAKRARGCCGSGDVRVTYRYGLLGRDFMVGFNYGH